MSLESGVLFAGRPGSVRKRAVDVDEGLDAPVRRGVELRVSRRPCARRTTLAMGMAVPIAALPRSNPVLTTFKPVSGWPERGLPSSNMAPREATIRTPRLRTQLR